MIFTCLVTDPVAAKTVSKETESEEKIRKTLPPI
jgi:hypothetical protein